MAPALQPLLDQRGGTHTASTEATGGA
jgi:hypothetical protein